MKTQYVESLVVEVEVRYNPLLKASELLLLLLRLGELRMIVSSGAVGRAAPPYVLVVW
jgi:hypothetical protein